MRLCKKKRITRDFYWVSKDHVAQGILGGKANMPPDAEVSQPPFEQKATFTYIHCHQATEVNNEERIQKKGHVHLDLLNIYSSATDNSLRVVLKNHVSKEVMFSNWQSQPSFIIIG